MSAPEKFYEQLRERLRAEAGTSAAARETQNKLLDLWLHTSQEVTEYDARMWGLDTDKEMNEVLYMIAQNDSKVERTVHKNIPE